MVPQSVTSGYVLQNQGEGAKFYLINEGDEFVVPAGKCWMNPISSSVRAYGFSIDSSTAIKATENDKPQSDIYTLQGIKVKETEAGKIYVKDGKVIELGFVFKGENEKAVRPVIDHAVEKLEL